MADTQVQTEETPVESSLRSILSRVQSSYICRNVIGALGLGLVAGGSAGGCMGAMVAEMARFLNGTTASQTELTMKTPKYSHHPLMAVSYVTYMCLLVAILSSAAGLLCGRQAYNLVQRRSRAEASGKALALAAPVAVLGVAVTGAALGAITEMLVALLGLLSVSRESLRIFLPNYAIVIMILLIILLSVDFQFANVVVPVLLFTYCLPLFDCVTYLFYVLTGLIFFLDMESILLLFPPSLLFYLFDNRLNNITKMIPSIINTIVFTATSILHYKDISMPLLSTNKVTPQMERIFVIVFGIQMFQASCGAGLYSYFVTAGAGKVCAGAVAATAGVLAILSKVSSMLGTGASLGGLLAASGGAGVALNAAGDLGHRYGGHVGRAGAVLGAAVRAFLPLAAQDVKFGIMVSLCAASIPGSPHIVLYWESLYNLNPYWHIFMLCIWLNIILCCDVIFIKVSIYILFVIIAFLVIFFCLKAIARICTP